MYLVADLQRRTLARASIAGARKALRSVRCALHMLNKIPPTVPFLCCATLLRAASVSIFLKIKFLTKTTSFWTIEKKKKKKDMYCRWKRSRKLLQ